MMDIFLWAFTAFNSLAGIFALLRGFALSARAERAQWVSKRLYGLALFIAATLPLIAVGCSVAAWQAHANGSAMAGPLILGPLIWLVAIGVVFAAIDFAEDGRFDFGKGDR